MRVHHIAMRTQDVERLARFYTSRLGFRVTRSDAVRGSVWLDADGVVLMIERAASAEPAIAGGSKELVAFAIDDKEPWRQELESAGVPIEDETPHTLYFRDPDGRRVALSAFVFEVP